MTIVPFVVLVLLMQVFSCTQHFISCVQAKVLFHHCVQAFFFKYFSLVLGVVALCVVLSVFHVFHGFCRCLCQDLCV